MPCTYKGKGEAILFIHGMPNNGALWEKTIEQLAANHQCFAVDLPGMGKTPFSPYSADYLDRIAHQIEVLRTRYGARKCQVMVMTQVWRSRSMTVSFEALSIIGGLFMFHT